MSLFKVICSIHSFLTIITAYLCHIYKFKIVGFVIDYDVNTSSTLFVLSFAMLLAEYEFWPITLKKPCEVLLVLYEMLIAALLANIARTLVWIPAVHSINEYLPIVAKKITALNSRLKFKKYGPLFRFSRWLDSDCALNALSQLLAVAIFIFVLYTTDTLDHIVAIMKKVERRIRGAACAAVCEPPRRSGGICGPRSRRDERGSENDRATMSYATASGDAVDTRRDDLDSDTDEALPPPISTVSTAS